MIPTEFLKDVLGMSNLNKMLEYGWSIRQRHNRVKIVDFGGYESIDANDDKMSHTVMQWDLSPTNNMPALHFATRNDANAETIATYALVCYEGIR